MLRCCFVDCVGCLCNKKEYRQRHSSYLISLCLRVRIAHLSVNSLATKINCWSDSADDISQTTLRHEGGWLDFAERAPSQPQCEALRELRPYRWQPRAAQPPRSQVLISRLLSHRPVRRSDAATYRKPSCCLVADTCGVRLEMRALR